MSYKYVSMLTKLGDQNQQAFICDFPELLLTPVCPVWHECTNSVSKLNSLKYVCFLYCICVCVCACAPSLLTCFSRPLACQHTSTSHTLALGRSGSTRDVPAKSSSTSNLDPNTCNTKPWQPPTSHYQSYSIYRRYTSLTGAPPYLHPPVLSGCVSLLCWSAYRCVLCFSCNVLWWNEFHHKTLQEMMFLALSFMWTRWYLIAGVVTQPCWHPAPSYWKLCLSYSGSFGRRHEDLSSSTTSSSTTTTTSSSVTSPTGHRSLLSSLGSSSTRTGSTSLTSRCVNKTLHLV